MRTPYSLLDSMFADAPVETAPPPAAREPIEPPPIEPVPVRPAPARSLDVAAPAPAPPARQREPAAVRLDRATLLANGVFGFEDLDPRARSFQMLRSQLVSGFHRAGGRVLAVTSTQPGDGKSFVAVNLAAALSRIHPTVLVDLDLRRPAVAAALAIEPRAGIDDVLDGGVTLAESGLRVADADADLVVHPVRAPRERSAAMLAGGGLAAVFDVVRAREPAPICIVDTPPVMVLDDIVQIARHADGILMIVEEGRTRAADLVQAVRLLAPTPLVGSVLNKSLANARPDRSCSYYAKPS